MPLPTTYNYSPQLQPAAWWQQAQQSIPGLQGLPTANDASALASQWEEYGPHRSALQDLYQQSMQNPNVGQSQTGTEYAPIPTETGGSALAELLSSVVGTSRVSNTPLAGLPGQIGDTMYGYSGASPAIPGVPGIPTIQGTWMPGTGTQVDTSGGTGGAGGTADASGGGSTPPPPPPPPAGGTAPTGHQGAKPEDAPILTEPYPHPTPTASASYQTPEGKKLIWNGYAWV
jgi:hypothetical protein